MENKEDKSGGQRGNCTPGTPVESVTYRFHKAQGATEATLATSSCDAIATQNGLLSAGEICLVMFKNRVMNVIAMFNTKPTIFDRSIESSEAAWL